MLDALLDNSTMQDDTSGARFPLTRLKHISQSMQPKQIAERVALFRQLKSLFDPLAPLILRLDLAEETIRYYRTGAPAQYVLDNRSVHLAERVHERYLRLIAFVAHQYISVGDALILTARRPGLFKAIASTLGACEQELKEKHYFQERKGELIPSPAVPLDFLDLADRQHVFTAAGKLRISLYKVLLFRAVRDALRDGSLTPGGRCRTLLL